MLLTMLKFALNILHKKKSPSRQKSDKK